MESVLYCNPQYPGDGHSEHHLHCNSGCSFHGNPEPFYCNSGLSFYGDPEPVSYCSLCCRVRINELSAAKRAICMLQEDSIRLCCLLKSMAHSVRIGTMPRLAEAGGARSHRR